MYLTIDSFNLADINVDIDEDVVEAIDDCYPIEDVNLNESLLLAAERGSYIL